jgi:hypothetical protein
MLAYDLAMATVVLPSESIKAMPTLTIAAALIGVNASTITRAIKSLEIEPVPWGSREKHLTVRDLLEIAMHARRASIEEVAGGLLEWVDQAHPDQVEYVKAELDAYFAALPEPVATGSKAFLSELRESLPLEWATEAEAIWRRHRDKIQ